MKTTLLAATALLALLASPLAQADGVYRWVDSNGRVHYSDLPPPPDAAKVEARVMHDNRIQSDKLPLATRKAAENFPVTLYTGDPCSACPNARQFLRDRGVPFSESLLKTNDQIAEAQKKLNTKSVSVPTLLVGDKSYVGFNAGTWDAALDAAAYPPKPATPAASQ